MITLTFNHELQGTLTKVFVEEKKEYSDINRFYKDCLMLLRNISKADNLECFHINNGEYNWCIAYDNVSDRENAILTVTKSESFYNTDAPFKIALDKLKRNLKQAVV